MGCNSMDIVALKAELDAGHPISGPYNADDATAAAELNVLNRAAKAAIAAMRDYFLLERKGGVPLMGRLEIVATEPVGTVDSLGDGVTTTLAHKTAAMTLLRILNPSSDFAIDVNDSRFIALLDDLAATGAKVIAPADKTALEAMSNNKQSRGAELGFGKVGHADVEDARKL